jgi:hypothetical protein
MSRSQKKEKPSIVAPRLAKGLRGAVRHGEIVLLAGLVLIIVAGGSYWGWQLVQRRGLDDDQYRVDPQDIVITPPPEWITPDDLKRKVMRDASLDQSLSILDDNLTERIALAFAAHPWVKEVARVEKFHPARVEVELVYRDPVAAVVFDGKLLPVDRDGVLLSVESFPPFQLQRFPRVRTSNLPRPPAAGAAWPDARVVAAAQIAAAFGPSWHEFDLAEIVAADSPAPGEDDIYTFELVTTDGTRIPWGRQYLEQNEVEPSAIEKRDRLKRYVDLHGTLNGLSFDAEASDTPRTARAQ